MNFLFLFQAENRVRAVTMTTSVCACRTPGWAVTTVADRRGSSGLSVGRSGHPGGGRQESGCRQKRSRRRRGHGRREILPERRVVTTGRRRKNVETKLISHTNDVRSGAHRIIIIYLYTHGRYFNTCTTRFIIMRRLL